MATEIDERTWTALPKAEVIAALDRTGPARIPLVRTKWWGEGLEERYGEELDQFDGYPEDAMVLFLDPVQPQQMGLSWKIVEEGAHDARAVVDDWAKLDEFIDNFPIPRPIPRSMPWLRPLTGCVMRVNMCWSAGGVSSLSGLGRFGA